jgi:tRNA splicing ligase
VQYSYSHTGCDMSNEIVQECRGIIIDSKNWEVVAFPYTKFFNFGDPMADAIDWRFVKFLGTFVML